MPRDVLKTFTYLAIHLTIGFTVAFLLTGSVSIAGGIAILEPCVNAIAFFFHEKAWKRGTFAFMRRTEGEASPA